MRDWEIRRARPEETAYKRESQIEQFASLLGWHGIEAEHLWIPPEGLKYHGEFFEAILVSSYSTADKEFFIQINECPIGQHVDHHASIVAERYGLRAGWFNFRINLDASSVSAEGERLRPFLDRKNYENGKWRKDFIQRHPEYVTWQSNSDR